MADRKIVQTLRQSAEELRAIDAELDAVTADSGASAKRHLKRWKFPAGVAIVSIADEHGNRTDFVVSPRNISGSGFGALHGGFLHPGMSCCVGLRRLDGSVAVIKGSIARCRHIKGNLHEIGIRFEESISPGKFMPFEDQVFQREHVDLTELRGTVLVVVQSPVEQRLIAHHFKKSNLDILFAPDVLTAIGMLDEQPDIVIVDHAVGDWQGVEAIRELRENGITKPVLLQTVEKGRSLRDRAIEAGADEVLMKPCPPELLHQAVAEFIEMGSTGRSVGSSVHFVVSSAHETGVELDILEEFLRGLSALIDELSGAAKSEANELVKRRSLELRGTAESLGFLKLGESVDEVLQALACGQSGAEVEAAVDRLRGVATRCRAVA